MSFIHLIVLVSFVVELTKSNNIDIKYSTSSKNKEISWDSIEQWLANPMKHIPFLNLMVRSDENFLNDIENIYTQWFFHQTKVPLKVGTYEVLNSSRPQNRDNYAIVTSMIKLRSTARHFAQRTGLYFFVIIDDIEMGELLDICKLLWQNFNIYKNFILTPYGVLIYDPFEPNDQGEYGKVIEFNGTKSMERTVFHNMRGYPLRIQIFKSVYSTPKFDPVTKKVIFVYGVDGRVAEVLQKRLNFTMHLQDPDRHKFGERNKNGTYNGVIGSIIKNELDLCLTGFFVKDYKVPQMEFSVAVYDDKLCIYTPKAKRIPQSILPILSVRYDLWLGFVLTAFVCSIIWLVLRGINLCIGHSKSKHRYLDSSLKWQSIRILIDTWVLWVRVDLSHYPPFSSEKIFIGSLCLVSVIFGAIFESSLATVYIHPMYYKDINTMSDLDRSGLYVIYKYSSMGDDLFFSETSPLFANLNKKLRYVSDLNYDILKDVVEKGGKTSVSRYTTLTLEYLSFIVSEKIWIVLECPKYYTISYVWPKDAPWEETVNQLLLRIQNAGLIKKYIADMQTTVDIDITKSRIYNNKKDFKILTIEDLQLAFYVVVIGSLMAFASVALERYMKPMAINGKHK